MKALLDAEATLQFAQLMENSDVMVAAYDPDDRLRFANRMFRAAWLIPDGEKPLWGDLMRRNYAAGQGTVINTTNFDDWLLSTQARRGKVGYRAFETDLHDGRWLWMTETTQRTGWMLCVASDITSLRSDERALRQDRDRALKAVQIDDLTGIASRRYVMSKLDELVAGQYGADDVAGCIAVLDIDNFKYINDRFGHAVGDAVLRHFAASLHRLVRKTDILGRVGGEEFVLVLPNTSVGEANAVLERMLVEVRHSRPLPDQVSFRYTFSAGIACAMRGDVASDIYQRADLALYAAKMRGRDQVGIDVQAQQLLQEPAGG